MKTNALTHPVTDVISIRKQAPLLFVKLDFLTVSAITCATLATFVSLAMGTYTAWHSSGVIAEQLIRVFLIGIVVLYTHLLPAVWRSFRGCVRIAAFGLWSVAIAVILYSQTTFFMVSQQHAADIRAAAVTVPAEIAVSPTFSARSRAEIAKEALKLDLDLGRAEARRCTSNCPMLRLQRNRLTAEIAVLKIQDEEAKRRDAIEDRHNLQVDRIEQLRATLRSDPVAFRVASWLGTTERLLELLIALAHGVVLEGAAIIGWMLVAVAYGRATGRSPVSSVLSCSSMDRSAAADKKATVPKTENDRLLELVHAAVVAGEITPTQASIRKLLKCGQPKAGNLNRQYAALFAALRT